MNRVVRTLLGLMLLGAAVAGGAFLAARADPVIRRATIALPHWPSGAAPVRVVLMSDLHVGTMSSSPDRLGRIVAQVNALQPDLVLIAGDFLPGHDTLGPEEARHALAHLAELRAPLGVVAVPGNHDHWTGEGAIAGELEKMGIVWIANRAIERGPLAIGGIDDAYTRNDRPEPVVEAVRKLPGAPVLLTHSPDVAPGLPGDMPLLLAGHTHCGQVVLPWYGSVDPVSRYGRRYECGLVREGVRTTIVTAGIGTSGAPFRFGAPPDIWLLTLGPKG